MISPNSDFDGSNTSISTGATFLPLAKPVQEFIVASSQPTPTHVWNLELVSQFTLSSWSITAIPSLRVVATQMLSFFMQSISVTLDDAELSTIEKVSA